VRFAPSPDNPKLAHESNTAQMARDTRNALLVVDNLSKSFRGVRALQDYRVEIHSGDLLGVIGPNGAGKTTLFNLLTGIVKPSAGRISLRGTDITGQRPESIARQGVARTFQKIRLLPAMTAIQNVRVAVQSQGAASLWRTLLSTPAFHTSEAAITEKSHELLLRVGIAELANERVFSLSYSQQRRLELACALGLAPQLLLLDEPTAGMNPTETDRMIQLVLDLQRELELAIILIEHNMQVIMNTCHHIQALNYGEIIGEGSPDEIRNNQQVIEAYLGHGHRGSDVEAEVQTT
jgi:branched-chain amino acid transport system ATP-binding protein